MTPSELYDALDRAGVDYEIVEIFEGVRVISVQVWDEEENTPPQRTEQEPVPNVEFMRQVLSVAIAGLYEHYKDDVLRVFTLDELQTVIDLSESFRLQQVEDIYKRAWDMLAASAPPQRTEQEPVRVPWSQALESVWGEKDEETDMVSDSSLTTGEKS